MKRVYSEVIYYVLIPLFLVLALFGLIMFISSRVHKDETDRDKIYHANFWSAVIGIIFGAIIESLALGFTIAFIQKMKTAQLVDTYQLFCILLYILPVIPFIFLLYIIVRFIRIVSQHTEEVKYLSASEDYEERDRFFRK